MGTASGFERVDRQSCRPEKSKAEQPAAAFDSDVVADRRTFLEGAVAGAAALALPNWAHAALVPTAPADEMDGIRAEIEKRHDEAVERLQHWIQQPSIAAENRGMNEGCELTMHMLGDAGFEQVSKVPTDGQPGIFATLDAGAPRTVGLYFMYDVKQADPAEWSSPPFEAALVDKPGLGKVVVGRGAVNQKGPEATFLAALHAMRGAGKKMPVNFVFVAEGEEEIGSPHFPQVVRQPEVAAALRKCTSVFMPYAAQGLNGEVTMTLGAKGVVELELVSSGVRWGRGPKKDLHSSNKARVDSPAWHLVEALASLVSPDGNDPVIEGFAAKARPLSDSDKKNHPRGCPSPQRSGREKTNGCRPLGARCELARIARAPLLAPDGEYRRPGRRLHRPGRQNHLAREGRRKDRHASRAGHDRSRSPRRAKGPPRQKRLWRYRSKHERRVRSDKHTRRFLDHSGVHRGL
jgi:hypothetical protein